MPYRDDLTALSAHHDALAREVAAKTRELEEVRHMLDEAEQRARERARLPVLDNIRVAAPCTADWAQMTGDDRVRHCGACDKSVYNLSGMTREEAEALVIERNGDLCVRYFQRTDGTILLADCTVGVKRRRRQRWIAAGAATLLASGGVAAMAPGYVTMGGLTPAPIVEDPPHTLPVTAGPSDTGSVPPREEGRYVMGDVAATAVLKERP